MTLKQLAEKKGWNASRLQIEFVRTGNDITLMGVIRNLSRIHEPTPEHKAVYAKLFGVKVESIDFSRRK